MVLYAACIYTAAAYHRTYLMLKLIVDRFSFSQSKCAEMCRMVFRLHGHCAQRSDLQGLTSCVPIFMSFNLQKGNSRLVERYTKFKNSLSRIKTCAEEICFYEKIRNFNPIIMKICQNDLLISRSFWQSLIIIGLKLWIFY